MNFLNSILDLEIEYLQELNNTQRMYIQLMENAQASTMVNFYLLQWLECKRFIEQRYTEMFDELLIEHYE